MGTCYTYLLNDDFDWGFDKKDKEEVIKAIKEEYPVATVVGQWYGYIVIDLDKISPYGDRIQKLQKYCSSCSYYADTTPWDIQKVEFKKLPEDLALEAIQPQNRNKHEIELAYDNWGARYANR